ncbi:uncharacterized protein BDV17DRAFT_293351 [Aspergillus undulatus]|uniref:uncharacterized protein n=1 Tax=Aspergillus undulatus TaxID=1810928 RepID=UPI003CCD5CF6
MDLIAGSHLIRSVSDVTHAVGRSRFSKLEVLYMGKPGKSRSPAVPSAQCAWGELPKCDDGSCCSGTTLVANSSTGSGADYCRYRGAWMDWKGNYVTYQERVYCCDQEDNTKWDDSDGGRVQCCKPKYITVTKRPEQYNDEEKRLDHALKEFMEDPTCGITDQLLPKRSLWGDDYAPSNVSFD